jgi:vacuolar-type H+-ATPase subunit F/Vma7
MFDKKGEVAIIGEKNMVFAFRSLGFKTYSPRHLDEAREILSSLEQDNVVLCFLHQSYFEPLQAERIAMGKKFVPVIVGFSDYRKITDHLENMMKEMAVKATGSDALVKRRGNHGTR